MFLIVGLGNPGRKYAGTRHNVGFMVADYLAAAYGATFTASRWQGQVAKLVLSNQSVLLFKPETYMNRSGTAVAQVASFHRIEPARILVVHDDLDMELARIKMVINRGAGGHNGIRSLITHLGTRDFPRIKVGVGRPPDALPADRFVLSRFSAGELDAVREQLPRIEEGVKLAVTAGTAAAMNFLNTR